MAVDERARHELHTRLEEILGADPATTLMSYLPPVAWADVARKHDIDELRREMDLRFELVDRGFEQVDERFDRVDQRFGVLEERIVGALYRELNQQSRALFFALAGLLITLTGLGYAAVQLG